MRTSSFLLVTFLAAPAIANPNPIEKANDYTVKISAVVEYAFGAENKGTSRGAGFLIDRERGWILTNAHVARRAPATIRVNFKGQTATRAQRLYIDTHLDVSILQVPPDRIPANARLAELDCQNAPRAGQQVIAFGHPWGLDFTATRGIISGTKVFDGVELLQTDAALNPGNSGGALIDEVSGRVVGINTSGLSKAQSEGMNFATPISLACTIVSLMKKGIDPSPPKLPVRFAETLQDGELVIAGVRPPWSDSLRIGDRVLGIGSDMTVTYGSRFVDRARGQSAIEVQIKRGHEQLMVILPVPVERDAFRQVGVHFSGMLVAEIPASEKAKGYLRIDYVDAASLAQQAQVRLSDELIAVDGQEIASAKELFDFMVAHKSADVELILRRPIPKQDGKFEYFVRSVEVETPKFITEAGER